MIRCTTIEDKGMAQWCGWKFAKPNLRGTVSDEHRFTVISKGGASIGKSPQMQGWGAVQKEAQLQEIIGYIRTLSGSRKNTCPRGMDLKLTGNCVSKNRTEKIGKEQKSPL